MEKEEDFQDSPPLSALRFSTETSEGEPAGHLPTAGQRFPEDGSQGPSLPVPPSYPPHSLVLLGFQTSSSLPFPPPFRVKGPQFEGKVGGSLYLRKWIGISQRQGATPSEAVCVNASQTICK